MQTFSENYTNKAPLRRSFNFFRVSYGKLERAFWVLLLGLLLAVSFAIPAIAASTKTVTEQNQAMMTSSKEIALQFAQEGWGTKPAWAETWDALVSPNFVFHFNSAAEPIVGLAENKVFNTSLFQGFPDIRQTIEDMIQGQFYAAENL
jgi:hypothetical protein